MSFSVSDKDTPNVTDNTVISVSASFSDSDGEKSELGMRNSVFQSEPNQSKDKFSSEIGKFRELFRQMPQPVVLTRMSDERVVDCSDFFENLSGISRDDIVGRTSLDFETWYDENERSRFLEIVRRDGVVSDFEARLHSRKGLPQNWLLSARTIDIDGVGHILVSFTNIEDRKKVEEEKHRLEEQLRQQQKLEAIGTLTGSVAHEINNPINIIMNFAELIKDDSQNFSGAGVIKEYAAQIISESGRISNMVRNLLSFSRQNKEQSADTEISQIVEAVAMLTHRILAKDDINLNIEIESALPPVRCRSQQIMQVIMNLLINSRDALNERYDGYHPEKRIEIRVFTHIDQYGKWQRISVQDNGCGIKEEHISMIFEPFFSTKPQGVGTGLGLSVSRGIIEEHGGRLSFEKAKNGGSIFNIDLPQDN